MSLVTNVLLLVDSEDEPGVPEIQNWLAAEEYGQLVEVSKHAGGRKAMECRVWAGAFNHLDTEAFVSCARGAKWERIESVQLLIREEDDAGFWLAFGNMEAA